MRRRPPQLSDQGRRSCAFQKVRKGRLRRTALLWTNELRIQSLGELQKDRLDAHHEARKI
ncbi:unnamed protein product [Acanthoscelides obtectus]|uniref:Uncharacterized protein n=1 Tax=Acanthoscelides obtectus TaxID=200917 RepID=A0A9P0L5N5_ACAOB|nr:unnamed protein product [Acanthoscelides obtectus]CAK1637759.1 hypothetical protein AOBTE_LOCUS10184 [Acanthoscelides obtectus]